MYRDLERKRVIEHLLSIEDTFKEAAQLNFQGFSWPYTLNNSKELIDNLIQISYFYKSNFSNCFHIINLINSESENWDYDIAISNAEKDIVSGLNLIF
eukprot:Pgem_evm1s2197